MGPGLNVIFFGLYIGDDLTTKREHFDFVQSKLKYDSNQM